MRQDLAMMRPGAVAPTEEDSIHDHNALTAPWCGTQCRTGPCLAAAAGDHGRRSRAHGHAHDREPCSACRVSAPALAGGAARAMDRRVPRPRTAVGCYRQTAGPCRPRGAGMSRPCGGAHVARRRRGRGHEHGVSPTWPPASLPHASRSRRLPPARSWSVPRSPPSTGQPRAGARANLCS
jgi:hypothetical protein